MRYKIMYQGRAVAEFEYCDLAESAVRSSPVPVTLVDEWSGKTLPVSTAPNASYTLVTDENPYGLPLNYIKSTLTKYYLQGGQAPKIPLIKLVRELTGISLSEAKDVIDRIDADEDLRARRVDPTDNS